MRVRVLAYAHTLPANLYTYLDAAFTAAGANNIVLGGLADPTKDAYGADNPAGKIVTWNLFPATTMTTTQNGFATAAETHCNYNVTIPNTIGYPEHKRCLIQVQSLSVHGEAFAVQNSALRNSPLFVGVEVEGIAVHNNFSSHITTGASRFGGAAGFSQLVGCFNLDTKGARDGASFGYGFDNHRSILDDGVLCSTPFGRQITIKLHNLTNKQLLNTNCDTADGPARTVANSKDIINNPTHLTLRLLFLDDDELPMR